MTSTLTYVEVDFFGEDDPRSNLVRLVAERFTKKKRSSIPEYGRTTAPPALTGA